jgi:integrase
MTLQAESMKNAAQEFYEPDIHSFRRTFATRLAEVMIPYEFIQRLLGHETDSITEEYIKYSPKMRERFYNYVELIVGDQEIEMVLK